MKSVFTKFFVAAIILATAQASHASAADGSVVCRGGGYTVAVSYIVAITDNAQVQMKIEKNKKTILEVSTEGDEGQSVGFIHNAYTTATDADSNGNILHYGSGIAPTRLLAFSSGGKASEPKLIEVNLEKNLLLIDQVAVAKLACKNEGEPNF